MKIIRGTFNRIVFFMTKYKLHKCGNKVLFEYPFEIEGEKYISVGNNVRTKPRLHLAAIDRNNQQAFSPIIIIGNDVSINYDVHIACINKVEIGDGTLLASKVFITDHFHGDTSKENLMVSPSKRELKSKGPVVIGKNVWIGEGVAIMPGVTIGDNSVIGSNTVVTHDIPQYSVAVGAPARIIKSF